MKFTWVFALIALALAGCETQPKVSTDLDPQADFQRFATYHWVYQAPPAGMNPLNYERIQSAIDGQLAAKGYRRAAENGDFAVAFTVGARDKIRVTDFGAYGPYYGAYRTYGTSVDQYTEGSLAIDVFDARTQRPVWRAVATERISESGASPEEINGAVTAAMASFPPRGGAMPPAPAS
jgi:hypothetical protein